MTRLVHVGNTAGDWEAVYVNGKLVYESHDIYSFHWVNFINEYCPTEADSFEVPSDYLDERGGDFPDNFNDIPKEVFV